MMVRKTVAALVATLLAALAGSAAGTDLGTAQERTGRDASMIERGRYMVRIAGCNDCHTPHYAQTGGRVAERDWLVGDRLGWHGPWGTTFATNLRISLARMSEDAWVHHARSMEARPPMPWFALRDMAEDDLRAIHRFVRSLGVAGEPAPAYLPPGEPAPGLAVLFPQPPK